MRIALISDIHGNDLALRAVLQDIHSKGGVDAYWVLGDLAAIGHAPVAVLEMLQRLPNAHFVRGNTDRYTCTGERPGPVLDAFAADPSLLPQLLEVEGDFSWAQGAVTVAGWFDWMAGLPLEYRTTLPDGTRVLCVHASPGADDGSGIHLNLGEEAAAILVRGVQEDLICVGHTHRPFSLSIEGKRVINPGSVSLPVGEDVRACYAIIDAHANGYDVNFFRAEYDQQAVIEILEHTRHPARRYIIRHLRGKNK